MKKLIVVACFLISLTNYAQEMKSEHPKSEKQQMSPDQKNELALKKMTLALDLNASQQKDMGSIISEMSAKRESQRASMKAMREKGEKPTADQKYEMKNKMLDEQATMKSRVQKILTTVQYEKWEQMKQEKKNQYNHKKGGKEKWDNKED